MILKFKRLPIINLISNDLILISDLAKNRLVGIGKFKQYCELDETRIYVIVNNEEYHFETNWLKLYNFQKIIPYAIDDSGNKIDYQFSESQINNICNLTFKENEKLKEN